MAICILIAVLGAIVGSFFNVLIHRMPRNESIVLPASHCPACNRSIPWFENIPILSYLFLRGRCHGCTISISLQYPAVELLTAAAAVTLWLFFIPAAMISASTSWWYSIPLTIKCLTLLLLIPIVFIDLRHYIIPDSLTIPLGLISAAIAFLPGNLSPLESLYGVLAGGGFLLLMGIIGEYILKKKDAMGGGDIKLMAGAGALFGWQTALESILIAAVTGALIGSALLWTRRLDSQHRIPFGPFLAIGLWIAALWRTPLMQWYLSLIQ